MDFDEIFTNDDNIMPTEDMVEFTFKKKKRNNKHYLNNHLQMHTHNNKKGWILRKNPNIEDENEIKIECIEFYKSFNNINSKIIHAITGEKMPYFVGTNYEKLYFKVALCTGEIGTRTYLPKYNEYICETNILFYNSPEELERHQFCKIPDAIKERWYANRKLFELELKNKSR